MNYNFDNIPERITKEWRHNNIGKNTKQNGSEKFQKAFILNNLGIDLSTFDGGKNTRINKRTYEFRNQRVVKDLEDFYDWTEDFDGIKKVNNKITYWNLKIIPNAGGAQNRSIRPVMSMVEAFANHIKKNNSEDKYFICITDGDYFVDFAHLREGNKKTQFEYAIDVVDPSLRKYFYCGPLKNLKNWWESNIV